ncbi:hypothetical protein BCR42DRAFT_455313 [Absidia repens]|uniref:C2H2-type domain-containing protein n=1 Tax=Absidia repens TaxID=90262 RepID=A0A1X2I443_9FUNG|nr:hypothetical protein BCR42DRAFT_455313 [Absidia repens]
MTMEDRNIIMKPWQALKLQAHENKARFVCDWQGCGRSYASMEILCQHQRDKNHRTKGPKEKK